MPELPEVSALVDFLTPRLVGEFIAQVDIAELSLLHTADPPLDAVIGLEITGVRRVGKALVIDFDGLSLVCRFARAGWLVWHDAVPSAPVRMGKGPLGMRVTLASGSGFDLTEAGTKKNASVSLVRDLGDVAALAGAGPDALEITAEQFAAALASTTSRIKTVLDDQSVVAGIGNAFSDEILHTAKISPFATANKVDAEAVYAVMTSVLGAARDALSGLPPAKIKSAKKKLLRVHGRTGQTCPVCGTTIAEVSFADRSLQYCPGCQTGGKRLSDRRMDRLLK
ncbi:MULTISPECIES: DNA-formamidopyrimidine glycosylase family protein [unclassified Brevibacterium]|uniref:DNA-formamidopyrimidine glycosylase family protein n=1 Tax=unclassified Brevibacterium TaxID=2614124 RepID=UPI0010F97A5E|nr:MULTISPECIES: DNA-formamidopyrimidine glycosylase family protein [unclassified Brevibacterium]MCM1013855.1 Fpg/Nei family DNA glycosylase [Brevibacterium sp. XM4083]